MYSINMTQQKEMYILSDSKSGVVATSPWVRIPPSPPGLVASLFCGAIFFLSVLSELSVLSSLGEGVVDGLLILEYQKSSAALSLATQLLAGENF